MLRLFRLKVRKSGESPALSRNGKGKPEPETAFSRVQNHSSRQRVGTSRLQPARKSPLPSLIGRRARTW